MSPFSLTQLVSGTSANLVVNSQPIQVLKFQKSPTENTAILVSRIDIQGQLPLFSFTVSKSKPQVQLRRIGCGISTLQPTLIGEAVFHSFSGKIDLTLDGQPMTMESKDMSGSYSLKGSPTGKLKWEPGQLKGRKLKDEAGTKIAKFNGKWTGSEEAILEVLVPCDDQFLDLIVLSITSLKEAESSSAETVSAVLEAVGGLGA